MEDEDDVIPEAPETETFWDLAAIDRLPMLAEAVDSTRDELARTLLLKGMEAVIYGVRQFYAGPPKVTH